MSVQVPVHYTDNGVGYIHVADLVRSDAFKDAIAAVQGEDDPWQPRRRPRRQRDPLGEAQHAGYQGA